MFSPGKTVDDMFEKLEKQNEEMLTVLKQVSTLLDALRMDNAVGYILTKPQKEIYKNVDEMVKRVIANVEAK